MLFICSPVSMGHHFQQSETLVTFDYQCLDVLYGCCFRVKKMTANNVCYCISVTSNFMVVPMCIFRSWQKSMLFVLSFEKLKPFSMIHVFIF